MGCVGLRGFLLLDCFSSVPRLSSHSVDTSRDWPRRATHFLCFAKESKQRKATLVRSPFGVPEKMQGKASSALPDFAPALLGTPEGGAGTRGAFLAYLFGEAKR